MIVGSTYSRDRTFSAPGRNLWFVIVMTAAPVLGTLIGGRLPWSRARRDPDPVAGGDLACLGCEGVATRHALSFRWIVPQKSHNVMV